jgi:hypothetical protein
MDAERFDGLVKALAAGTHRRRVLGGLLGTLVAWLGPGRAGATQSRLCCSAVCLDGVLCAAGHVVPRCFKLKDAPTPSACPPPPPGYELTGCREVVPNCSDCGKTVCPARE